MGGGGGEGKGIQDEEVKVKPTDICIKAGGRIWATSIRESQSDNGTK